MFQKLCFNHEASYFWVFVFEYLLTLFENLNFRERKTDPHAMNRVSNHLNAGWKEFRYKQSHIDVCYISEDKNTLRI